MDFLIGVILFLAAMVGCLVAKLTMIYGLLFGLAVFLVLGVRRGFTLKAMLGWGLDSVKESLIVIEVMMIIGLITASWRISGTITVFVYYGMKIITPPLFLLITFLLACILSYALGTSFGVSGTMGVIFVALARSGGVDPVITAGVVLSGVYFGDRCSPVASAAHLVAGCTGTNIFDNVKLMLRTGLLPLLLAIAGYTFVSIRNPISQVDPAIIQSFEDTFSLSVVAFIPAVIMFILPLLKLQVTISILISAISGFIVAFIVQGASLGTILNTAIFGYVSPDTGLGSILNGGGMMSMIEVVLILIISCAYSGIFNGTGMLKRIHSVVAASCRRFNRFVTCTITSLLVTAMFCNQTIATLLVTDLLRKPYEETGGSDQELAIDLENTSILFAGLVPWCLGCYVILGFLGVGTEAVPWAFYIYLVPLCYLFTKGRWFEDKFGTTDKR